MHEVLLNRLGGLSLSRKGVVRLTDRPDMTLGVYSGRQTTTQQQQRKLILSFYFIQYYMANRTTKCLRNKGELRARFGRPQTS